MAPEHVYIAGWKGIAAALGVSVRTAQRLEVTAGLPVRRIGPRGGGLQVRRDELERWRDELERWRELPAEAHAAALPPKRLAPAARANAMARVKAFSPARGIAARGARAEPRTSGRAAASIYRIIQASVVGALEVMASPIRAMTTRMRWLRVSG